jgi:HK97 family phage portal protein
MPPAFLQDLTHGTFSNVEQQDLQLVKHVLSPWVKAWEAEAQLKLFGRGPGNLYLETSLDAILRGDLLSRAEALAKQIASGQLTPNESRTLANRPPLDGGDVLFMQGAMAPVSALAQPQPKGNTDE